jgi:hypothetical protein
MRPPSAPTVSDGFAEILDDIYFVHLKNFQEQPEEMEPEQTDRPG